MKKSNKKNRQHTIETREKIRKWNTGKKLSEETKQKISKSCVGKGTKKIIQLSLSGKIVNQYDSIKQAELISKISNISLVCNGRRKSAGGFIWRFV